MTMTEQQVKKNSFLKSLDAYYERYVEGHPLEKFKSRAWEKFREKGLPTRKDEVFRYVKLHHLYAKEYAKAPLESNLTHKDIAQHVLDECRGSVLVFINGHYSQELSCTEALSSKIVVSPLKGALRTYSALLTNQWNKMSKEETDPFALLNFALQDEGVFVYVPPNVVSDVPLQVLHIVDSKEAVFSFPRFQLFMGKSSQLQVTSTQAGSSLNDCCICQVAELSIEENAHLRFVQADTHSSSEVWHFDAVRATLKKDAFFEVVAATEGSASVRNDYRVVLVGTNAEASLNGVWMLKDAREAHYHVLIDHQAPNCISRQLYKGALDEQGHSSFEGKILVRSEAQQTNAFQLNNNLLLSDQASAESKPNLEIFADDVKASHGATVGQLDKEELFYMKTRGFSDHVAKNLLINGFCQEVVDKILIPSQHKAISMSVRQFLTKER